MNSIIGLQSPRVGTPAPGFPSSQPHFHTWTFGTTSKSNHGSEQIDMPLHVLLARLYIYLPDSYLAEVAVVRVRAAPAARAISSAAAPLCRGSHSSTATRLVGVGGKLLLATVNSLEPAPAEWCERCAASSAPDSAG